MGCCCFQNLRDVDDIRPALSDSRVKLTHDNQALTLKEQGNQHFKKKAYLNAIRCYTQALSKSPNQLVYYTNLALAYKANGQLQQAIKTIDRMQKQRFSASLNYAELMAKGSVIKARCINSVAKTYIVNNNYTTNESQKMLQKVQKAIKLLQQVKKNSQIDVNEFLNNSLKIQIYLAKIKKNISESHVLDYLKKRMNGSQRGLHHEKGWQKVKDYFSDQGGLLSEIKNLYAQLQKKFVQQAEQDEHYLIDPITYVKLEIKQEKFKDPVVVPSGISYEQQILRQYFKKGDYKDPITKQKFQVGERVIVKNHSLKNYITEMGKLHQIKKQDIELLIC